jgi:hypothetical protein
MSVDEEQSHGRRLARPGRSEQIELTGLNPQHVQASNWGAAFFRRHGTRTRGMLWPSMK